MAIPRAIASLKSIAGLFASAPVKIFFVTTRVSPCACASGMVAVTHVAAIAKKSKQNDLLRPPIFAPFVEYH